VDQPQWAPSTPPYPNGSGPDSGGYPVPAYPAPTDPQPYSQQPYVQPYQQQPYAQAGYQPPYPQPGYPQPGYSQPGYPQPGYPQQVVTGYPVVVGYQPPANGMGTASMVLGIIGTVLVLVPFIGIVVWVLAPVSTALGAAGLANANRGRATNRGVAVAGLVLGIVSLVAVILVTFLWSAVFLA
jgi:hypothetical protein